MGQLTSDVTKNGNIGVLRAGDAIFTVFGPAPLTDESWIDYLELLVSLSSPTPARGGLGYSQTAAPNSSQRRLQNERYADRIGIKSFARFVLVSDSSLVRGAVTAMSWLMPGKMALRTIRPNQLRAGMRWLHEELAFDLERTAQEFEALARRVGADLPSSLEAR